MFVARKETAKRKTTLRSGADAPRSKDNGASWSVLAFGAGWKPALQRRFAFWKLKRPFGAEQTLRGPKTTALCFLEIKTTLRGGADAPRSYDNGASWSVLAFGAGWKPALQRRFAFWKLKRPFGAEQTLRGPKTTTLRDPTALRKIGFWMGLIVYSSLIPEIEIAPAPESQVRYIRNAYRRSGVLWRLSGFSI